VLAQIFDRAGKLDNLQKFVSDNAVNIYNIEPNKKTVILEKKDFVIPEKYGDVVPYRAGETIDLEALGNSSSSAIMIKSCSPEPRDGNPTPRYVETDLGSINSM